MFEGFVDHGSGQLELSLRITIFSIMSNVPSRPVRPSSVENGTDCHL